jgi:hypothetical protein
MFQNWINLITSLKLSLPNILFFFFFIAGAVIWKFYTKLANNDESQGFFLPLDELLKKKHKKNKTDNNSPNPSTEEVPAYYFPKDYSYQPPTRNNSFEEKLHTNWDKLNNLQTGYKEPQGIDNSKQINSPSSRFRIDKDNETKSYFQENPSKSIENFRGQNTLSQSQKTSFNSSTDSPKEERKPQINIIKKYQPPAQEQDFAGFLALEEQILEEKLSIDDLETAPTELKRLEGEATTVVFHPPFEIKSGSIPRFKQVIALRRSLEANDVLFLIGETSVGKTYLVSLLARELKYSESRSVISFSFSQQIKSLGEGFKLILIEQLKLSPSLIDNPIQSLLKILSETSFLLVLSNVELLSNQDLTILTSCHIGRSKIIMLSSSLSAKSLSQGSGLVKRSIIELQDMDNETVQNFFLERIPQAFNINPVALNKLTRFVKGNPLVLVLLCAFVERQFRNHPQTSIEETFKQIDNYRVLVDKNLSVNLSKILHLTISSLSRIEGDILLFASYLPFQTFSASLIEHVFNVPIFESVQILDNLHSLGLIQKMVGDLSESPTFSVHSLIREFVYKEFPTEQNQLINKTIGYYLDLLQNKSKLERENATFIVNGLIFALKVVSGNMNEVGAYTLIFERATDFIYSLGLIAQIEDNIIPLYEDNLKSCRTQDQKAFWLRLLGQAYVLLANQASVQTEKATQMEYGIKLLNQSLELYSSLYATNSTRQAHNDLGKAYQALSELHNKEVNLIAAVDHFKKAVQIQVTGAYTADFIQSHINLANVYLSLYKVKPSAVSLQLSIQILTNVAKSFKQDLAVEDNSFIHQLLGNALRNLASHENPISNLQAAVNEYRIALEGSSSNQRALIYNSLGCCFWKLAKYNNPVHNIELAISVYKKSLEFVSQSWGPFSNHLKNTLEYAVTQNNLGTSYKTLASLKSPEYNIPLAIKAFKEALQTAEKQQNPNLAKVINQHLRELGNLVDNIVSGRPEQGHTLNRFKNELIPNLLEDNSKQI